MKEQSLLVIFVFAICYLGMIFGKFPGFKLDRIGIALLCALILVGAEKIPRKKPLKL